MKTYDLAYHLEQRLKDGSRILLELHRVHVDNVLFVAKEIGDVLNGLALEIQGQSEDVDSPIVKTSLTMSFVDVPERNSLTQQWGSWEFLYTPDSEGWKVVLLVARNGEDRFRTLWSGYVTPDSYTETLSHHGVVTITARDNIGHLADMEFDGVGNGAGPFATETDIAGLQIGDFVQFGRATGDFYHTPVVVGFENGEPLLAAHTYDAFGRKLSSYTFDKLRCLRVLGARV